MERGVPGWAASAPLSRVLLTAGGIGAVVTLLLTTVPAPLWARVGALDLLQVVVLSCCVVAARGRRRREAGRGRLGWGLIAVGLGTVGVSVAIATGYAFALQDVSPVSWRDSITALGLLAFAGGLVALCGGAPLTSRWLSLMDTVMAGGACLFVIWQTLLSTTNPGGLSHREQVLYSYLGGMALVLMLALLLAARFRGDGRTLTLIGAGLGAEVVTLVGLAVASSQGHEIAMSDPRVGVVFPFGTALIGLAAAQRPTGPADWGPIRRQWNLAFGLPLASGAVVAVTAAGVSLAGRPWHPFAVTLVCVIGALLLARQALTLLENRRLTLGLEELVTERTSELEESRRHFRDLVQHSSDVIAVVSSQGELTYCSPAVTGMLGYAVDDLLGMPAIDLVHEHDVRHIAALTQDEDGGVIGCRVRHADGSWRSIEATIGRSSGRDQDFVVNVRDVTERQLLEERLRYQAYHDPLTGLANRALIQERMRHALLRARRTRESTALVFVDLDDFKRLNDTAGHSAGDEALVHVADVIRGCIRPHDTAARLGGDEFAVLLEDAGVEDGAAVADRIVDALKQLAIPQQRVHVSGASAGVSVVTAGTADGEALLRDADIAMYQAKASGRGRSAVFTPHMREQLVQELAMESALRTALEEGALDVAYQPIVDVETREIEGVEALVRWQDAHGVHVPPSLFIPLAEQVGLIGELDRFVLLQACRELVELGERCPELAGITLNVNVSARDFDDAAGVEQRVLEALAASRLAPHRLVLEITETAVLPDLGTLIGPLEALRAKGIRVSLDDFGTGYSSMTSLKQLPLDEIKIDGSFVAGLPDSESASRVVEGIVSMARLLGLPVVAEAVETEEQAAHLRRMQCDLAQGWLYAPPMRAADLAVWSRARLHAEV